MTPRRSKRPLQPKKEKLREKLYDLIYSDDLEVDCSGASGPVSDHYKSHLYDKIVKLLEEAGVYLDKGV